MCIYTFYVIYICIYVCVYIYIYILHIYTHKHYCCCCLVAKSCLTSAAIVHQAPLSMEFPRQEYWSRLPFPSPGDLPDPGIEPMSLASLAFCIGMQILFHWVTSEAPSQVYAHIVKDVSISKCQWTDCFLSIVKSSSLTLDEDMRLLRIVTALSQAEELVQVYMHLSIILSLWALIMY